jgi:hypothetical protein
MVLTATFAVHDCRRRACPLPHSRDLSPAEAKRASADLGFKTPWAEFHLNYTFAETFLGVVGPTPVELVDGRRASVFTSPQASWVAVADRRGAALSGGVISTSLTVRAARRAR